jgi:hypothetical protein
VSVAGRASERPGHERWWFVAWAAIGCGLGVAAVSFGPLLGIPVIVVAVVLAARRGGWRHGLTRSAWGVLCGLGIVSLFVAYVQRKGPGTVYWHTATASGADTYLDPRPWLAAGVALVGGGILAFVLVGRRARRPAGTSSD